MLKAFEKFIFTSLANSYNKNKELRNRIFLDTNLVYRENLYSDGKPIFSDFNNEKLCPEYGISDFSKKKGKLTIPDSLRGKIFSITPDFDFDKDSVDYRLYSMPVWSKTRKVYIVKIYIAEQYFIYRRRLYTRYAELDEEGRFKEIFCPNPYLPNNPRLFESAYWSKKLHDEVYKDNAKLKEYQEYMIKSLEIDKRQKKEARDKRKAMQKSGN